MKVVDEAITSLAQFKATVKCWQCNSTMEVGGEDIKYEPVISKLFEYVPERFFVVCPICHEDNFEPPETSRFLKDEVRIKFGCKPLFRKATIAMPATPYRG